MHRSAFLRAIALALALLLVGASCGSDDDGSRSATDEQTTGPARPNSTTTAPASASGARFEARPNSLGYIGCSNTWQTVQGYDQVPGNKGLFWPPIEEYNEHTFDFWANASDPIWDLYDEQVSQYGQPQAVWAQICEKELHQDLTYDTVVKGIENLRQHSPDAVVYVSPLNSFDPPSVCDGQGTDGTQDVADLADQIAAAGLAERGPDLGPLTASQIRQGCHGTTEGRIFLGTQLAEFFDPLGA